MGGVWNVGLEKLLSVQSLGEPEGTGQSSAENEGLVSSLRGMRRLYQGPRYFKLESVVMVSWS